MRKQLESRARALGIVDTKKYRYMQREDGIYRIERDKLDTTEALKGWEKVVDDRKQVV